MDCVRQGNQVRAMVVVAGVAMCLGCGGDDGDADRSSAEPEEGSELEEGQSSRANESGSAGGGEQGPVSERPRVMPLSCWLPPDSSCDVRAPEVHCEEGETCDLIVVADDRVAIRCLPGEDGASAGEVCDNRTGLFCGQGLHCVEGVCRVFCCGHDECGDGAHCASLLPRAGTLGVCLEGAPDETPSCRHPGAACSSGSDCCSGFCHVDHCH